ncbi:MAG: glycerol-3-phosphate dehydrogenase [Chitinophagales bacterium]|nr:MAG: glycerol-3-phosphate dehydrogenase [Chitinophagales bacterium]
MKRRIDTTAVSEMDFDVLIIGGGITGAGIFKEAGKQGYRCLLAEKGDFASGTSSRSAKLIHGGLRYLRHGQIGLVRESLQERNYLLATYPHLVKPLPFLFPVFRSKYLYSPAMSFYQFLGKTTLLPPYRFLDKRETFTLCPFLPDAHMKGSFLYYDAVTNDARLCVEVIDDGTRFNNNIALNYCEVTGVKTGRTLHEVICYDHIEKQHIYLRAKVIINASGVWTDQVLQKLLSRQATHNAPSKGIHLVFSQKKLPLYTALIIPSYAGDGRMNYALPWEHHSVLFGTTDTDFNGDPDQPDCTPDDIYYLLHSLNSFFTGQPFSTEDILFAYSGLRPLMKSNKSSRARSRDYSIWWENDFILNISGGKLTGFHAMALNLLRELRKKISPSSSVSVNHKRQTQPAYDVKELPQEFTTRILSNFTEKAPELLLLAQNRPTLTQRIHADYDFTLAEALYYIRHRSCYHLDDLLTRRLALTYVLNGSEAKDTIITQLASLMKTECGWSEEEYNAEVRSYYALLLRPLLHEKES